MPASPDSVTFDVSRYEYQGAQGSTRVWHTPDGDGLGIFFFPQPPDIPAGLSRTSELRDSYASLLGNGFRIIECRVQRFDGIPGVWLIAGGLDPKSQGAVYLGSITIPFRDFSYVIKMQAFERGATGVREAILVEKALREGTGSIQNGRFVPHGWSMDDEQFDPLLPQHPLPRLRRELRLIAESVRIDQAVKAELPFALPGDLD